MSVNQISGFHIQLIQRTAIYLQRILEHVVIARIQRIYRTRTFNAFVNAFAWPLGEHASRTRASHVLMYDQIKQHVRFFELIEV